MVRLFAAAPGGQSSPAASSAESRAVKLPTRVLSPSKIANIIDAACERWHNCRSSQVQLTCIAFSVGTRSYNCVARSATTASVLAVCARVTVTHMRTSGAAALEKHEKPVTPHLRELGTRREGSPPRPARRTQTTARPRIYTSYQIRSESKMAVGSAATSSS